MQRFLGGRVWQDEGLQEALAVGRQKSVAIAYASAAAPSLLHLQQGDRVVVDASDASVQEGLVDPEAVATWRSSGVNVYSLPALHAKLVHIARPRGLTVVGSANASRNSRDELHEAALLTDDPEVAAAALAQLDAWVAQGTPLDQAWVDRARRLPRRERYRPKRSTGLVLPEVDEPLWVSLWSPTHEPLSAAAERAHAEVVEAHAAEAHLHAWAWQLHTGDARRIKVDHGVLLVRDHREDGKPDGRARADAPAKIVRVTPAVRGKPPVAHLVVDARLPRRSWAQVRSALPDPDGHDWSEPLRTPEHVRRVLEVFRGT